MNEILEAMRSPSMRHAMIVHFPIVLSILCVVFAIAHAVTRGRDRALRVIVPALFAALLLSAWLATNSGEGAEEAAGAMSDVAHERLEQHEEMADKVWIFALTGLVVSVAGLFAPQRMLLSLAGAGALAAGVAAGWIGLTAHHGGTLVYDHGVGTPKPPLSQVQLGADADLRVVHFRDVVVPILADRCLGCHSGDEAASGLDLTGPTTMLAGGMRGVAVLPGDDNSLLLRAIRGGDEELDLGGMPPRDELTDGEIEAIAQWVREGAVWQ